MKRINLQQLSQFPGYILLLLWIEERKLYNSEDDLLPEGFHHEVKVSQIHMKERDGGQEKVTPTTSTIS